MACVSSHGRAPGSAEVGHREKASLGPGDGEHEVQEGVEGSEGVWKVRTWGQGSRQEEGSERVWVVGRLLAPFQTLLKADRKKICLVIKLRQNFLQAQKHIPQKKGKKIALALNGLKDKMASQPSAKRPHGSLAPCPVPSTCLTAQSFETPASSPKAERPSFLCPATGFSWYWWPLME